MTSASHRKTFTLGISTAALAMALMVATPAQGQATAGIRGHVEGAPAGSSVTATDATTGQRTTVQVDAQGNYNIPGLRPGSYQVQLGANPPQEVRLPVGETATVDFGANGGAGNPDSGTVAGEASTGSEIVVTGTRRSEVRTATIATNISTAQIENLPQSDRNFLNFAALAPGVQLSRDNGNRQIQAGAVSADNVNVYIDGGSYKNQVAHGGVAGQSFSQGNPFPQLAIQEFRVETQNFKAEYDQAGSAIINAVTKTGGKDFHGDAFFQFQPKAFIGRPYFDRPGKANNLQGLNPKPDYKRYQYGGDLGGPIIPDVLHFYVAYEATDQTSPSTAVLLQSPVPQSIISAENGSFGQGFNQDLLFGKLTLFATNADTIDLTGFYRKEKNLSDFGNLDARSHGRYLNNDMRQYQATWTHRGDNWLNEAIGSYQTVTTGTPRATEGPEIVLTNGLQNANPSVGEIGDPTSANLGAHFFIQSSSQKVYTFKDNLTFYGGSHTFKAGVKFSHLDLSRLEDNHGNGTYYFNAATYTGFDSSTPYAGQIATKPVIPAAAKDNQLGLFIQDDWTIDEHLTVNLGLRWDYESNMFNNKYVTPGYIVTALNNYAGWKAAGINPADYISTGNNRKPFYGAFQPRIGVSYDLYGDRDLVLFAGAGRYYDRNVFLTTQLETIFGTIASNAPTVCLNSTVNPCARNGDGSFVNTTIPYSASLKDPAALRAALTALNLNGSVWLLNNDAKVPFSDQYNFGVRKRFGEIQTTVAVSHIRSFNRLNYVRGNRLPNGTYTSQGDAWIADNFPVEGQLSGFNGKLNISESNGKSTYTAIYLSAEKPYTREKGWGFTTAVTFARARTNVPQGLSDDEVYNAARQDAFGWNYVPGVDKWRVVATGITNGPWGTTLSASGTFASGGSFGSVKFPANPPANYASIVGNFAGVYWPDQVVGYANVDLRIEKRFKLPWGHELSVDASAFNVFDSINRQYSAWGAGSGDNPTKRENATVGNARSFQVGASYKF